MGTLTVQTFVTADGIMQAPGGPQEDTDGGFAFGGWSFPHWDEPMNAAITEHMNRSEAILLGRRTYQIFASHWPNVPDDEPVAAKLNRMPKYVASRTLSSVDWANSTLLGDDVPGEVAELKQRIGGEIGVPGSANLIQTLLRHGLVDRLVVWTFPLVLGQGKRLFGDGTVPAGLTLESATPSSTGVLMATYTVGGEPEVGSFALEG
jgi:dihydrofolate reductase